MSKFVNLKFILCIAVIFGLASCHHKTLNCVDIGASQFETEADPFKDVKVEIGIDGSGSITGFVNVPGSLYSQAIDSLSTLLNNKNVQARYWRVGSTGKQDGSQPQQITSAQFLEAKSPSFYDCKLSQSKYPCVSSTLHQIYNLPDDLVATEENVAASLDTNETVEPLTRVVKILITDLEPDQSAIAKLSGQISQEIQKNPDYKVVLLGVRSQYEGAIFSVDTGLVIPSIGKYSTKNKNIASVGRPFYLLMTGPSKALDSIVESFKNLPLDVSKSFRVTSFENSNSGVITLAKNSIPDEINSCTQQSGRVDKKRPSKEQDEQWLIMYQRGCQSNEAFNVEIWSKNSLSLLGASLTKDQFISSSPSVSVDTVKVENDRLSLITTIDPQKANSRGGQIAYITLPKKELDTSVWSNWNTTVDTPDGSKTQNLLLFVYGLRESVKNMVSQKSIEGTSGDITPIEDAVKFCIGITK